MIQADVKASNGVIHAINAVLLPSSVTMSRPAIRGNRGPRVPGHSALPGSSGRLRCLTAADAGR